MIRLVKAEIFKLLKSPFFWMLFLFALLMGILNGKPGSPVTGYMVYQVMRMPNTLYAGWTGLFAAAFVCDEFSNRTFGMSLCCGATRCKVLLSKALIFIAGGFLLNFASFMVALAVADMGNGFGIEWNRTAVYEVIAGVVCFVLETILMGAFALLTAVLTQDRIGTFAVGAAGSYIIMFLGHAVGTFFYGIEIFLLLLGTVGALWAAVAVFEKTDLR
ncbi:MAG: ABC transporter permease [Candidatus Gastranaerophilales bacterium]|nr:ABC transporter permease [Candidatus Gastranaerophilales bacterium]